MNRFLKTTLLLTTILVISQLTVTGQVFNKLNATNSNYSKRSVELSHGENTRNINTDSVWMHYDDVENYDSWGFLISGELYDVMAKWDPADLTDYQNYKITKVKFIVVHDLPIIKVKVWEGTNGTEIYSQDVPNYNQNTWTVVTLDTPVDFDHTQELYVGYEVDMTMTELGGIVTATDDGPPIDGYGNLYRWNGTWYSDFNNHNLRVMIENPISASFTASPTEVCAGSSTSFTDTSEGAITGWEWTFEGGTPATSSLQNPTVTYNTIGNYDVTLVVTDGSSYDTTIINDYISAVGPTTQANVPVGETSLCNSSTATYTTNIVQYAASYDWEVTPADAGIITGNDTIAEFISSDSWSGSYTVKVRAANDCGDGPWSNELVCELQHTPYVYTLQGDGEFCEGGPGTELTLDNSEQGVDYELYKDGVPTSNIVAGTGSSISFGLVNEAGIYSCVAFTAYCEANMLGDIWVHEIYPPVQPTAPVGEEDVCGNEENSYTTQPDPDVSSYVWTLDPPEAGILEPVNDSVYVTWNIVFSGEALLSVHTTNSCGDSPESEALTITVNQAPSPAIVGEQTVCSDDEEIYSTEDNTGSTYIWEIEGGTISSGAGTNEIMVLWGEPGEGWLTVTEENTFGCISTTEEFMVTIDECTNIDEKNSNSVLIFPNPATTYINIELAGKITALKEIIITNSFGTNIQTIPCTGNASSRYIFSTSEFAGGLYYVRVVTVNNDIATGKFMVINH